MDKRITWVKKDEDQFAYNDSRICLGYLTLENVGRHIHWCWYQLNAIRMSPGCLQEVRDKQKELSKFRKKK